MAKNDKGPKPRSRVKFVFVEVEGDDATLAEGLRSIATTLMRGNGGGRALPRPPTSAGQLDAPVEDDDSAVEYGSTDDDAIDASGTAEDRPIRSRRSKTVRTPEAVEIDLKTTPTLQDYLEGVDPAAKNPDRVLLAAMWMRDHREIDEFGPGHVYTCFRAAKWSPQPRDYVQVLSDMARKTQVLAKTPNGFRLTHLGEDRVRQLEPS